MPRPKNRLTLQQKRFADALIKTGDQRLAAQQTYNPSSDHSASSIATTVASYPQVVSYIESRLADLEGDVTEGVRRSIAIAREMLDSGDPNDQKFAMAYFAKLASHYKTDAKGLRNPDVIKLPARSD